MNYSILNDQLIELNNHHYNKCIDFKLLIDGLNWKKYLRENPEEIFIHANLFKVKKLLSINSNNVQTLKMSSSGTTGNRSNIYADRLTRANQQRALINIFKDSFNLNLKDRFNYYVIANKSELVKDIFDAQMAAIKGFSLFAKESIFLLDSKNHIIPEALDKLRNDKNKFFIFGFTSKVYLQFLQFLKENKICIDARNSILLHGGGWKKLNELRISNTKFNKKLFQKFNLKKIHNYYGMVEQTGSIFLECEKCNSFITSNYSDILIRGKKFEILDSHKEGFIQLISLIPTSYPGNSILSDDLGMIVENDCTCKKLGKRFKVNGRILNSEIRGCSNV